MTAKVTIGGVTCLGSSPQGWSIREGVTPFIAEYDVRAEDADGLLGPTLSPQTLLIEDGDKSLRVDFLYVIEEIAGPHEHIRRIRVADRRWWWNTRIVFRRFNIRRRVGVKRLTTPGTAELQPVVEDIWYAPWSTQDEDGLNPWTARQVLENVFKRVLGKEQEDAGQFAPLRIETTSFGSALSSVPIEGLEIQESGDRAIARVLAHLPQAAVRVDPDGTVVVYSRASGQEDDEIKAAGAESVGGGHVVRVIKARIRPKMVRVFFTREVEVRFNYTALGPTDTSSAPGKDDRDLDNVLPIPDFQLGDDVQGTWLKITDAITAWGTVAGYGLLTLARIRRGMLPFLDIMTAIATTSIIWSDKEDWAGRIAAITQNYRQTFRINQRWMSRILAIKAYRVGIIDQETGSRSPAVAYSNFCRIGGALLPHRALHRDGHARTGINVERFSGEIKINSNTLPAPARVSVIDSDQGIINLSYLIDPTKMYDVCLPGLVENLPTTRMKDADENTIAWDLVPESLNPDGAPTLSATHRMAVILTAMAGAPNDERQLHKIEVAPGDIADMLPPALKGGISNARGPVMEILIAATPQTTAKVVWSDDDSEKIEAIFGINSAPDDEIDVSELTVNAGQDDAPLDAIAQATAASVYAMLSDRLQGGMTVKLTPKASLAGWLGEVTHVVSPNGRIETRLRLREGGPEIDIFPLLPTEIRAQMMRLAQPGGQA